MERVGWTDERLDDRMSGIDRTFDHVFEELRADRAELRAELRAVHDRLTQVGFGLVGIQAAGLIALVATQL